MNPDSELVRILTDSDYYTQNLLKIKDKDSETVLLKYTPIQQRVAREQKLRNVYLKPRQVGMSTMHIGKRFARVATIPNWTAVTCAHDDKTTLSLFQRVHFFYNQLPSKLKPKTKYLSKNEIFFPEWNSRYIIFTAGNENGIGRGDTINDIHGSEVSRWPNPDGILSGLLETAPKNAYVDLESTANGAGDFFNTLYDEAKAGLNGYKAFFFPWWWQPEYRLTIQEALDRDVPLGENPKEKDREEEADLVAKYRLDINQIYWRRWKKATLKRQFQQEYPEDDATCFLTTGNLYFDLEVLQTAKRVGELKPISVTDNERFKVWEKPVAGHSYMIGADVAEGVANGDYSAAYVIDVATGKDVASLHGHWDTHNYAGKLAEIGRMYNMALIAVERNNHGHAVLEALIYNLHYPNIYKHKDYDATNAAGEKPGFPTNIKTRPIMLSTMGELMEKAPDLFRDSDFFTECFRFVQKDNGKAEAQDGCHDDRVIARAIVAEVWAHSPRPRQFQAVVGGQRPVAQTYTPR